MKNLALIIKNPNLFLEDSKPMEKQEKEEVVKKDQCVYIDIDKLQAIDTCEETKQWEKIAIYRVPPQVANLNPIAYKPQIVSIGPYHNGEPNLTPMEEHKYRALFHVLRRSEKDIQDFLASLREVAQELMLSYDELDQEWRNEKKFLELMLLDGCFILEVLRANGKASSHDYCRNDPVFSVHGILGAVYYVLPDLLKIENQLPLLALETIVTVESCTEHRPCEYILNLVCTAYNCENTSSEAEMGTCLHLLDLMRKLRIGSSQATIMAVFPGLKPKPMEGAAQLSKAGITFRRSERRNYSEIKFQNGILYLPILQISPSTASILLNFIAFERLHPESGQEISSYVRFIDGLTRSVEDAKLLASRGILLSSSGSSLEIKEFIHKVHRDMNFVPRDSLHTVQHGIEAYYWERMSGWNRRFHDWGAHFKETYFKSPWSLVALLATVLLLALTIDQSIYTSLSFYRSK